MGQDVADVEYFGYGMGLRVCMLVSCYPDSFRLLQRFTACRRHRELTLHVSLERYFGCSIAFSSFSHQLVPL
jgi:hypothetical protein